MAQFAYDSQADHYTCPAGQTLKLCHLHAKRGYYKYRAAKGACEHCALKPHCTRDRTGRRPGRYPGQELIDRGRAQSHGEAGRQDRKKRQWFQERNFAGAATRHGFKTARWRRLWRQTIQDYLIAAIQNLKILIRHLPSQLLSSIIRRYFATDRLIFRSPSRRLHANLQLVS